MRPESARQGVGLLPATPWHGGHRVKIASLRRHHSGQWMVKLAGKCHYLGVVRETAERRYRELIVEHYGAFSRQLPTFGGVTVAELLQQHVAAQLQSTPESSRDTRAHYYHQVTRHAVELYGSLDAESFGPKAFKAVRQAMCLPGRRVSYVNHLCIRLRAAWKWGVSEELVSESSYSRLLTVKGLVVGEMGLKPAREVVPVPEKLFLATLPFLTEDIADLLRLLWITGARPGEILSLTPAELVKDGAYLVYRPKNHKTAKLNKLRAVVFGAEAQGILKRYWPAEKDGRFFVRHASTGSIRKAVQRACDRGKLEHWHPYQLRHAAVTRIALEYGKEVATAVAGHARVLTTERYDHGAVERAKRAAG
ncbi:MAG: tyrosine-type recombinase/integrase [Planctomycetia bacterium]|nr:tyrosine-type recombinase/integrase [Planctomycetia bacterium]